MILEESYTCVQLSENDDCAQDRKVLQKLF